jgi:DNA-binding beta-propeller fold protein YncE
MNVVRSHPGEGPPVSGRSLRVKLMAVLAVGATAAATAIVASLLGDSHAAEAGTFPPFGPVTMIVDSNVAGTGVNVDTIAFWDAPDPMQSLMFVSSKDLSLVEVWKYPYTSAGDELTPLRHNCLHAASTSGSNGVVVDQDADLLYVASSNSPDVCVFSLPSLALVQTITSGVTFGSEPNLALLTPPGGARRLYVSNDTTVYVHDATGGQKLSQFTPTRGLETMWGDNHDQVLYIPDENGRTGVYAYEPDGTAYTRNGTSRFGGSTIFDSDAEGILEYTCPVIGTTPDDGTGLIVVSDQIDSSRHRKRL